MSRARCIRTPMPWHPATGPDTANENQFTPVVDAQGYVIGGSVNRLKTVDFLAALKSLPRLPLDACDIVMPKGWARHIETGRGMLAEEVAEHDGYYLLDLRTTYALPNEEAA